MADTNKSKNCVWRWQERFMPKAWMGFYTTRRARQAKRLSHQSEWPRSFA